MFFSSYIAQDKADGFLIRCFAIAWHFSSKKVKKSPTNQPVLFFTHLCKKIHRLKFIDLFFEDDLFYSSLDGFAKEGSIFAFALD